MRILVVMDPIEAVNIHQDTSFGLMWAAQERGHALFYCGLEDLFAQGARGGSRCAAVKLKQDENDFYDLGPWQDLYLDQFDSVWMRKDPPVNEAYLHATHILDLAGPKTIVMNRPSGVRYANEKMYALAFPEWIPETLVTRSVPRIRTWLEQRAEPLIVKPIDGHGGAGVFLLEPGDRNVSSILETITGEGRKWVVVQAYLPEARQGDKRIIMINGEPEGAILRVPQDDDHRGNIHVGGTVRATELTERDLEICAALGPRLRADGLCFVGLDVIGDYLTEVNVTSPTGIREFKELTGTDLGASFVIWLERAVANV